MKPTLTIGAIGLAVFFFFGGLLHSTVKAQAACVGSWVQATGKSYAWSKTVRKRRAYRRAYRNWKWYVYTTYGSPFSNYGYAKYKWWQYSLGTARVRGVPCDANQ
jgi:hypothetical protein